MFLKNEQRFSLVLMLVALSCLSSCTAVNSDNCPVWPTAGPTVAVELERVSYSEFPNSWEWIGRLNKLRQELELCR
jgi:hypothetical protein